MRKKHIQIISVLLCAVLLAACGKSAAAPSAAPSPSGGREMAAAPASGAWQTQFVALEDDQARAKLQNGVVCADRLYVTSSGVLADETPEGVTPEWPEQYWVYGPIIERLGLDGKTERLPYVPETPERVPGENSGVLFEQLYAEPEGGLWVLENRYRIAGEEGAQEKSTEEKRLVRLAEDGSVLRSIPLDALAQHADKAESETGSYAFTVPGLASDAEGNLCVAVHEWFADNGGYVQSNRICVLDEQSGALRQEIELDGEIAGLVRLGDGRVAAASYRGATPIISLLDAEEASVSEVAALDDFLSCLVGGQEGDALYYGAGDSFYRMHVDTAETEKLLDWAACDVAHSDEDSVCVLSDGRIVTTSGRESAGGVKNELAVLSPVEPGTLPERKVLRVAVMNLYPFTSEMVSRFNRSQSEYRIELTDYAQYNDYTTGNPEDWNAGLTRLQTELIAGNIPDIIDISLLPSARLGEKGILEDLLPYIQSDPELGEQRLNMHVLEAFADKGKLYQTVSNFYVMTTAALSEVAGDRIGWTMEDFSAAMQRLQSEHPESTVFDVYTTRDDALSFLLYLKMDDFVDWGSGEVRFDSESFGQLLSFVKGFPTAYDWGGDVVTPMDLDADSRMLMGLQLMKQCNLTRFEDVQANTAGLGGAACSFVGYPTEQGVGSMFAQVGNAFAISSACADKEAAWAFVRQFFLPVYQEQLSDSVFPTNLELYEQLKQEAQATSYKRNPDGSYALDENGRRIEADRGVVDAGGMRLPLRAASAGEIALVEELVAKTEHVLCVDNSLKDIIVQGAAGYFADQRSVEDAMKQIQSRASIYINEQR